MPKIIVTGWETPPLVLDNGPRLLCLTALRSAGYHVEDEAANVG